MTLKELFKREFLRGYRTGRGFKETSYKNLEEVYERYLFDNPETVEELSKLVS